MLRLVVFGLAFCFSTMGMGQEVLGRTAESNGGMVVTAHPLATQIGANVLRQGGTAFDAAIAVHWALAVVLPRAGNLGGGGFTVLFDRRAQRVQALDFRETAPGESRRDMYLNSRGEVTPGLSTLGALAVGVPGSVRGLQVLHDRYGTWSWSRLIEPSIKIAREGFDVDQELANRLEAKREHLVRFPETSAIFLRSGKRVWQVGERLIQKDLARTLERIAEKGGAEFYSGDTAKRLVKAVRSHGGVLSLKDLRGYQAVWRKPILGSYRGYEIASMPPPSSGGICLMQMLGIRGHLLRSPRLNELQAHQMIETWKRVYADRSKYLGDEDFFAVPRKQLLSTEYLARRAREVVRDRASDSANVVPGLQGRESEETTHYVVVDASGNVVSSTTTLNGSFGSCLVAKGTGILLNNEMDDFSVRPGTPNLYGLVGGVANQVEAGKRMLSSMTPTIVLRDGRPVLAVGSPGGSTIITTVFQVLVGVLDEGLSLDRAVGRSRFHHQWLPDTLFLERGGSYPSGWKESLQRRGHRVEIRSPIGNVQAVSIDIESGRRLGVSDPRGSGRSAGIDRGQVESKSGK